MSKDKRVMALVMCIVLVAAAAFLLRGQISNRIFPSPPIQTTGPIGEVRPGGEATPANFEKIRVGLRRNEVWSILGSPSGFEGTYGFAHGEWWIDPAFTISLSYNTDKDVVTDGSLTFHGGNTKNLRK